jgi:predicted NUDIX family NTP pyrophosphohydrolase
MGTFRLHDERPTIESTSVRTLQKEASMPARSAGVLLYRRGAAGLEVFLVHPGGPFWAKKDDAAWSIPKGLYEADEQPEAAARREFAEETGLALTIDLVPLGDFRQPGGKVVSAFAGESDLDPATVRSNTFTLEWPPRSGRTAEFPEVDRAGWFDPETAARKILKGQRPILDALRERLHSDPTGGQPLPRASRS